MIKKSSDGKGDVMEVTYEIGIEDEMELNEIDKDGNIIKRIK